MTKIEIIICKIYRDILLHKYTTKNKKNGIQQTTFGCCSSVSIC